MNHADFLEKDLANAIKHYKCCLDCLYMAEIAMANDDYEMAEARMIDFQRSLCELKRLKAKKEQYDRMKAIVQELKNNGVNIDKVARII